MSKDVAVQDQVEGGETRHDAGPLQRHPAFAGDRVGPPFQPLAESEKEAVQIAIF